MMTRTLSLTNPVFLGCNHSKSHESLKQDNLDIHTNITETSLGVEVILDGDQQQQQSNIRSRDEAGFQHENPVVCEEEILAVSVQNLNAASNSTDVSTLQSRSERKKDPLSSADSTLNRNWLDFPFFTDQKTVRHLTKGKSKVMFIMRGVPGSGKSSIVKVLRVSYPNAVVCSADNYFMTEDGVYDFDITKLPAAHGACQRKARTACGNGEPIVIIDNTNVKRFEMKSYLADAKHFGYVTILVEPKTDWKFNPEELFLRNSHAVPLEVLKIKVAAFQHIIPLYYGWFVSQKKSNDLDDFASKVFGQCLDLFPAFQKELLKEMGPTSNGISSESASEFVQHFYSQNGKTSPMLHCTSRFCQNGKSSGGKRYDSRPEVQASCGRIFRLTLTGLVITKRTCGLRVTLDENCVSLFERPEEAEWSGMNLVGNHHSPLKPSRPTTSSSTDDLSASSLVSLPTNQKLSSKKGKKAMRQQKKLLAKEKKLKHYNEEFSSGDLDENRPSSSLSLSELVNARIGQSKIASTENDDDGDDGDRSKDGSDTNNSQSPSPSLEHPSTSATTTTINDLFPELKNSGFSRSAHVTLKSAQNVSSVETNYDVLHACDIENEKQFFDPSEFVSVPRGKAFYFGDGMCCVYFDEPIKIDAVFSGFY